MSEDQTVCPEEIDSLARITCVRVQDLRREHNHYVEDMVVDGTDMRDLAILISAVADTGANLACEGYDRTVNEMRMEGYDIWQDNFVLIKREIGKILQGVVQVAQAQLKVNSERLYG